MLHKTLDTVARATAARISRRGSLLTLGGAGLAALARPVTAAAKKKKSNKKSARTKARRLANRKCRQQVEECQTASAQNGLNAAQIACCDFLGECDSASYMLCLGAAD